MHRLHRIALTLLAIASATLALVAQTQPPPQNPPPPAPAGGRPGCTARAAAGPGDPAGRGRAGGRGAPMWEPDFSKKPPVQPLTPAEQAKRFWLPPGFKLEPVLTDPDIEEPAQIAFDGNGRMFVLEMRGYMQDADGGGTLDPVGAHLAARRQEQRRRLRDASRLRRQAGVPALRHAVRRQRHPREGVERRRGLEVHRHQQRQRRRQERAVRHRHGPGDERRAPGERPHLGARQLDLQHHQSGPPEVDARRRAARVHRLERRAVGRDHGQLRQDVVPGRRQRHARVLPDAHLSTATSPIPNSSRPTSTSPGARRCSSPTCRAA